MTQRVRVGVVGCGAISGAYFAGARSFPILEIVVCADLDRAAAEKKAREFGVPRVCSVEELLRNESVDVVLNLTVPKAHVPVALRVIEAGKHVYSEKPLGVNREEGRWLVEDAYLRGVRVGCAPDTFLGSGIQTARKLIDDGAIGSPVAFSAFMMNRGHESWHPNPQFYYEPGGGPMFDMGPYYLTALFNFFGPIKRVGGMASIAVPERTVTSRPRFGETIRVETPDHVCGTIEFESGPVGTIIQSFATYHPTYEQDHPITVYGTEGTLKVPDPNTFDGTVLLRKGSDAEWTEVPSLFVRGYGRSVGLADMAHAIRAGRPHRASGDLAYAVLEAMEGFFNSSDRGYYFGAITKFDRPAPMPAHLPFGVLDD
jgi:predicted dehydrogenase